MKKEQIERNVRRAMDEADEAVMKGNYPFGCVATDSKGNAIAAAHNTVNQNCDPTAHAEINLLRALAKKLKQVKFPGCHVFINTEPCSMCASALIRSGVTHIYYGSGQEKAQWLFIPLKDIAVRSKRKIKIVSGILEDETVKQVRQGRKRIKAKK